MVQNGVVQNGSQLQMAALPFSQSIGAVTVMVYGTGLGSGRNVVASLGQLKLTVSYAGKQGVFDGLDQYNIQIPRDAAGSGPQTLSIVDGKSGHAAALVELSGSSPARPAPFIRRFNRFPCRRPPVPLSVRYLL